MSKTAARRTRDRDAQARLKTLPPTPRVTCPYCGKPAVFMPTSAYVYRGQDYGPIVICIPCDAYVGCHRGTFHPLGRLANKELRALKIRAHQTFDYLWRPIHASGESPTQQAKKLGAIARSRAYQWLAAQLGIPAAECHIGMFDPDRCLAAIEVIAKQQPTAQGIAAWADSLNDRSTSHAG